MPRYETSDKFWEIELGKTGKSFTVVSGKIGTAGKKQVKKLADHRAAHRAYEKAVAEKLGKGYRAVGSASASKSRPALARSNPELEAAIDDDPRDVQRWLVWADWLQQEGDPRGELIALRAAKKAAKATAYAKQHADALWGAAKPLTTAKPYAGRTWIDWNEKPQEYRSLEVALTMGPLGFVDAARFEGLDEHGHVASAAGALLAAPLGRFVRELQFDLGDNYEGTHGQPDFGLVMAALAGGKPRALRKLSLDRGSYQRSWTSSGDTSAALAAMPHLEELSIELGTITLGKLDLPALRVLRLETGGLPATTLRAIARAAWPALEELTLYFGTARYGCNIAMKDVKALLACAFPKLRRLALCNAEALQPQIAAAVLASPLVKQLAHLDLSKGTLTDEHAQILIGAAGDMKHLTIDVSESYFSPAAVSALRKAFGKRIATDEQRHDEMIRDRERYGQEAWAIENKETFRYAAITE